MRLRGRKGIRENLIEQTDLVILNPQDYKGKWQSVFDNDHPIHIELGMGKGRFIAGMSSKHPDINFIGMDMYDELVRKASEKARQVLLVDPLVSSFIPPNLKLVLSNIENIEQVFNRSEVERIYLNFSDPWPKTKHAKRMLTNRHFLDKYQQILKEKGEIHQKTDSRSLFEFSLNSFANMGLQMRNISLDLHGAGIIPNNVMTEYEKKFVLQGLPIYRCEVTM
jgi:tRNA (guanine-N7-)-methyltransferase